MSFITDLIKSDPTSSMTLADEAASAAEFTGWFDTGSYILNALFSGSLYGGIPNNKCTGLAGESTTGKTYFALGLVKSFQLQYPEGITIYFDTEASVTKSMMTDRGLDAKRIIISEPETLQKFRTAASRLLDSYAERKPADRPPFLFVLDSLGMLPTEKEVADTTEGKDTRDMTKAQQIRSIFRVLTLKLAKLKVPMIITNHTYEVVGAYVPTKEVSGGGGFKFAASTIGTLTKSKERDGTDIIGNVIKVTALKSRFSKENKQASVLLTYAEGLHRYYGLLPLAEKYGIVKKGAKTWEFPNMKPAFEKAVYKNPEKYFTPEIMAQLEEAAQKEYKYGVGEVDDVTEDDTGESSAE